MNFNKNRLFAYLLFILAVAVSSCSTVPVNRDYPSLIDLNKISMEARGAGKERLLAIRKNDNGRYFVALNLNYKDSGINVIESIKNGRILKTDIVIRDEKGSVIGREPINFQAFEVEKTTTMVEKKTYLSTKQGDRAEFQTSKSEPVDRYDASPKQYTDNDPVPQIILLDSLPSDGSWVSVVVELVYIAPFLAQSSCRSGAEICPVEDSVFDEIERDNNEVLQGIQQKIIQRYKASQSSGSADITLPVFKLKNTEDYYITNMKNKIQALNETSADEPASTRLVFRQWRLICAPRYFKIAVGSDDSAYTASAVVLRIIQNGPVAVCELQDKAGPFPKKTKISFFIEDKFPRLKNLLAGEILRLTFKIDKNKKYKDRYPVEILKAE